MTQDKDPHDAANEFMARTNQESIKKIAVVLKENDLNVRRLEAKLNGLMNSMSTLQTQMSQLQQQVALLTAKVHTGGATAGD